MGQSVLYDDMKSVMEVAKSNLGQGGFKLKNDPMQCKEDKEYFPNKVLSNGIFSLENLSQNSLELDVCLESIKSSMSVSSEADLDSSLSEENIPSKDSNTSDYDELIVIHSTHKVDISLPKQYCLEKVPALLDGSNHTDVTSSLQNCQVICKGSYDVNGKWYFR